MIFGVGQNLFVRVEAECVAMYENPRSGGSARISSPSLSIAIADDEAGGLFLGGLGWREATFSQWNWCLWN
jgi:hypothetical protein